MNLRLEEAMKNAMRILCSGLLLLGSLTGCEDATGPEAGEARVQAAAIGDGETASASLSPEGLHFSQALTDASGQVQGTVEFAARVEIQNETGAWVDLTQQAAQSAQVDASGEGGAQVFAREEVGAQTYTRARITFENVQANVTGGLEIGVGNLLTGTIQVNLGSDSQVVVEREIVLRAESGTTSTLVVDLNADAWLQKADAKAKAVSAADFQSAVRITAQS
jgi:hypothetical protein